MNPQFQKEGQETVPKEKDDDKNATEDENDGDKSAKTAGALSQEQSIFYDLQGVNNLGHTLTLIKGAGAQFGAITLAPDAKSACDIVLKQVYSAGTSQVDESLLPGAKSVEDMFSDKSQLVYWKQSDRPLQASRVNSNIFTSAEDALILRGRNLFGEREWYLIAQRYMPERLINSKAIL